MIEMQEEKLYIWVEGEYENSSSKVVALVISFHKLECRWREGGYRNE